MSEQQFYYDDPEGDALVPETSHPKFVQHLTAGFYYDCTNYLSPFGNDDGADLLHDLEAFYQEQGTHIEEWLFDTIDELGFKYASKDCARILDGTTLMHLQKEDPYFLASMDNMIIAAAFGQIKISGQVDQGLRNLAMTAIERQLLLNKAYNSEETKDHDDYLHTIKADLNQFQ